MIPISRNQNSFDKLSSLDPQYMNFETETDHVLGREFQSFRIDKWQVRARWIFKEKIALRWRNNTIICSEINQGINNIPFIYINIKRWIYCINVAKNFPPSLNNRYELINFSRWLMRRANSRIFLAWLQSITLWTGYGNYICDVINEAAAMRVQSPPVPRSDVIRYNNNILRD